MKLSFKKMVLLVMFFLAVGLINTNTVGATWSTNTEVVSSEITLWISAPSLCVGPDRKVHIAWSEITDYDGSGDLDLVYRRFEPGMGWTPMEIVSTESSLQSNSPSIGVDSDGVVHVAWLEHDRHNSATDYIAYKRLDPGSDWSPLEVISTENRHGVTAPSLDVGPDGKVHVVWGEAFDNYEPDLDITYRRLDPDVGWTPPEVVTTQTADGIYPSLAVGSDGKVHIAWTNLIYGSYSDEYCFYSRLDPGAGWTPPEIVSTQTADGVAGFPSLDVGPDGRVHLVWTDDTGDVNNIVYRNYEPGIGWSPTETVSTQDRARSYSTSLRVGFDGKVHIAWSEGTGSDDDIVYRRLKPGIGWTRKETVSTETVTHDCSASSLDVGSDGLVHIVWIETTEYLPTSDKFDIFYKNSVYLPNFVKIVLDDYNEEYSNINLGVKNSSTGELIWNFDGQYTSYFLEDGKTEYIIPFDVTDVFPSNEEIIFFVEINGWSGTITEFSVTCLNIKFTSNDPPVYITISQPGYVSVNFVTPLQVETSTGSGLAAFSCSSGDIETLNAIDEESLPQEGKPEGVDFPDGLFSFTINDVTPGETVTVFMELPTPVQIGSKYWKCQSGEAPQWFCLNIGSDDGDGLIYFEVTDGGIGDSDGLADGKIVDPGGSGFVSSVDTLPWEILIIIAAVFTAIIVAIGFFFWKRRT